jgi:hypothetical protein
MHEHPVDEDDSAQAAPVDVPPVPGPPPGVPDEDGPDGYEPPINSAAMSPE